MVTGIIMASGFSNRMGQNKLLLEIDKIPVIERVIKACKNSSLDEIILVYRDDKVREIGEKYNLKLLFNSKAHLGQSAAVILGTENSKLENACMFLVGDQPYLHTKVINDLIEEYRKDTKNIVVPYYNQKFGMPILFSPKYKSGLLNVEGDKGGREIIKNNPEFVKIIHYNDETLGKDMDTMEDYIKITKS